MKSSVHKTLAVALFPLLVTLGCAASSKSPVVAKSGAPAVAQHSSSLNVATLRSLQQLRAPVVIEAYVVGGVAGLEGSIVLLRQTLVEYAKYGNGNVQFEIVDTRSLSESIRQRAERSGLHSTAFADNASGATKIAVGYYGLCLRYKGEGAVVPLSGPVHKEELEYLITNEIREVYDVAEKRSRRVGVVSGKGELKLSDPDLLATPGAKGTPSLQKVFRDSFPFYSLEAVELEGGTKAIDPALDGLIVTQPGFEYSEPELRRIDEFLMRGNKGLAVFASAVNMRRHDPAMKATLDVNGLNRLLDGYGIHMERNAVLDFGNSWSVQGSTPNAVLHHPGIVITHPTGAGAKAGFDSSFAVLARVEELVFPFASSLTVLPNAQPQTTRVKVVVNSSSTAVSVTDTSVDLSLSKRWVPQGTASTYAIAAVAKGPLRSAFFNQGNGSIPVPPFAPKPSRVIVFSSSLFLANPFVFCGSRTSDTTPSGADSSEPILEQVARLHAERDLVGSIVVVKRVLDWMTADPDLDDGLM